ncbi:uncharacterized protein LOC112522194 isoform X2 [Cynara cardunculus var. scolymus]|uniref:uncharacterized protein LOC112522194 isoform X2 n=1 Tax=Cynara cardunculus var. scolymus TaxID=59895 RepID=UPI000D62B7E8|nr:uncharacterized protein LOC112522194 isoform X2 [Cynara cardunculus var. scolymus]
MERYLASLDQFVSPSSATLGSVESSPLSSSSPAESTTLSSMSTVEMTPSSSQITAEPVAGFVASVTSDGAITEETDSFQLESLVKHLRKSLSQVLHSADIDLQYKKLLDALVKIVIEDFYSLHEEKDMVVELFSRKVKIVLLSFGLSILFVSSGFILSSDDQSSYYGPPPT